MEWYTTESGKYRVESLSAKTSPGALKVIKEAFCQDEAVSIGAEVNKDPEAQEELLELCADAALDGVSLVAVEVSTGDVVAAAFNKLQVQSSDSTEKTFFDVFVEERCNRPSSKSLIQFMSNVDARCNLFEKYQTDCSLEIMFLATLREHRNQNLGTILCKLSVDLAKRLKNGPVSKITLNDLGSKYSHMKPREVTNKVPKICRAIWTGEFTQKIGARLGFNVEVKALMSEFSHNGKTYADRLGNQAAYSEVVSLVLD
ncbi:uncharacterized protein LOC125231765 [Leguminivora glycinivorella]|uniref:uncharacterized protein LOC125231765 n=1 Tax=Leguminivora glycinivorella TaxID=1035111 RepID=UPI00200EC36C|nr:uncharacterized protein LOC125231765 [Leguminivora glycinivorella]